MWIVLCTGLSAAALAGLVVDPNGVPWRAIEVVSILAGSLAIVSAISEWRKLKAENQAGPLRRRVFTHMLTLNSVASSYVSIVRFRISNEASNIEQYRAALPWFEQIAMLARADESAEPQSVVAQNYDFPDRINDRELIALRDEILSIIGHQEAALRAYREQKKELNNSSVDEFSIFFMPFFATLTVSLALFSALYQP